jgi:hypothetical protein
VGSSTAARLADYERRYRELAQRLTAIGYIGQGSITYRHNTCGKPNCRCHADPPQLHGPYYQWTAKVDGKTITRRLSQNEVDLYQRWIDNDREFRSLIAQMREVAAQATELILKDAKDQQSSQV